MATRSTPATASTSPSYVGPFITVAILFFIFGFITNLNMALVPHLRHIFDLPYALAMLAESAFFLAYFVFASPTSKLIETIGYKRTMVVALFIQVVGCLMFVPAAKLVNFPLFLTAVFVVGAGVTALQTAANPYVAILGPEHSAPARLTLAQALNSLGGTIAPLVAGAYILTDPAAFSTKAAVANTVRGPYIAIAAGLLILGLTVMFLHLPQITQTQEFRPGKEGDPVLGRSIWSYRHTVLGALGIFLYVGVEVGLASIAVNYFKTQGVDSLKTASFLVALYWGGALIGRLLGSWILTKFKSGPLLGHLRPGGHLVRVCLHVLVRPGRHLGRGHLRILQFHHVPEHLCAGHRRPRPHDQQGIGTDHDGGRGRRRGALPARSHGRSDRHPARAHHSRHLLPLHSLLRLCGVQANADCASVGWISCAN